MSGIMDSVRKPPPRFVKNLWAWAYAVEKLYDRDGLTPDHEGFNYGAAINIYKRVVAKYGAARDAEPLIDMAELTTHKRADLLSLQAPVWTVGHGAAWSANDEAHQRLYFQRHFHQARSNDLLVVEPIFVWRVERHLADESVVDLAVPNDIAAWLVERDPAATAFVDQQMREAITHLTVAIGETDTVDVGHEVGGVPVPDSGQFDQVATKGLLNDAIAAFRAVVTATA